MRFLLTVYLTCIITDYTKDFGSMAICRAIEQFIGEARTSKILVQGSHPRTDPVIYKNQLNYKGLCNEIDII